MVGRARGAHADTEVALPPQKPSQNARFGYGRFACGPKANAGTATVPQVSDVADTRAREEQLPWHSRWQAEVRPGPQINVAPLIDVLLTLIVVFMIVVAMEQDKGERVQIPQPQTQQTPEQKQWRTIVIQLVWTAKDQPPELKINGEQVKRDDLEARLAEIFLKRAEKVAFVRGDDDVDFQDVAEVIDMARHAGVQRVGLLTKERELDRE